MYEKVKSHVRDYGKVTVCFLLVSISFVLCVGIYMQADRPRLYVSLLDIGQGDAIFVQTPSGRDMLIDGGPNDRVLDELSKKMAFFDRSIDVVVATHPDADHVTGLIPVLSHFSVEHILVSGAKSDTGVFEEVDRRIDEEGARVHRARAGDVIDFGDGVTATILHPYEGEQLKDTNDASVAVLITYGEETFLLTGDLSIKKEGLLISSGYLPRTITLYKAGHHGSNTSSGVQLLSYLKPEYTVISAGKENKYGHPNPEAVERLKKYSKEMISTIDGGTISFVSDGIGIELRTEK